MKPKVYIIPGFGMNKIHVRGLKLEGYDVEVLAWQPSGSILSYKAYAEQIFYPQIAKDREVILIGYSMGGMVAVELAELVKAKKLILVSSAKTKAELPQKKLRIVKILGGKRLGNTKTLERLKPVARLMGKEYLNLLNASLKDIPEGIISFGIESMIRWDRVENPSMPFLHIHGEKDKLLPIKNINHCTKLPEGHFLLSGKSIRTINQQVQQFLVDKTEG